MGAADRAEAERFVAAHWAGLHRLALLVTDDPALAESLTADTLVRITDDWADVVADGHPAASARTRLLHGALGRGSQVHVAPPATDPTSSELGPDREELLATWHGLSSRERAAVTLVELDRHTEGEAAEQLGMPRDSLDGALASARNRLDRTGVRLADLAETLEDRVAAIQQPHAPVQLVAARVRRARMRRRRVVAAFGLGLAFGLGGVATWVGHGTSPAPAPSPTRAAPDVETGSWDRLVNWPARGSLARDAALARDVATRFERSYRVLWADDVSGRRYVLLVSRGGTWRGLALLSGAAGRPLAELTQQPVRKVSQDDRVVAFLGPHGESPRPLVVLTTPDRPTMQVSTFVRVDGHNAVSRTWETRPMSNGIGIRQVATGTYPALLIRTVDQVVPVMNLPASWTGLPPGPCGGCPVPDEVRGLVGGVRVDAAAATGIPTTEIRPELLFLGHVATGAADHSSVKPRAGTGTTTNPPERTDRATSFLLRLPSGATLRTTYTTLADYPWTQVPPAQVIELNEPVDPGHPYDVPLLIPVTDLEGGLKGFELVLAGESTVRRAQLVRADGSRVLAAVRAGPGTTWLPVPSVDYVDVTLRTWDAAGARLPDYSRLESAWVGPWDTLRAMTDGSP